MDLRDLDRAYILARLAEDGDTRRADRIHHARIAAAPDLRDRVRADLRAERIATDGKGPR
jgi:hypothetical protein